MQRLAIIQRTRKTLYIILTTFYLIISPVTTVSIMSNIDPQEAYAATSTIPARYQTAITKIRN